MADKVDVDARIEGSFSGAPVQVNLSGVRWWIVAGAALVSCFYLAEIKDEMQRYNSIKREQVSVDAKRAEIAQKQYSLDSLKWEFVKKNKVKQK